VCRRWRCKKLSATGRKAVCHIAEKTGGVEGGSDGVGGHDFHWKGNIGGGDRGKRGWGKNEGKPEKNQGAEPAKRSGQIARASGRGDVSGEVRRGGRKCKTTDSRTNKLTKRVWKKRLDDKQRRPWERVLKEEGKKNWVAKEGSRKLNACWAYKLR